jgi:hypothetical protein
MPAAGEPQKLFMVAEANQLLPRLTPLVRQLQQLHQSILQANTQMNEVAHKLSAGNGYPVKALTAQLEQLIRQQEQLIEAFQSALAQLEELGCLLKDVATGLVDFYHQRGEELVFLCWKLGEERVRFWHSLEAGVAGRQPLD